MKVRCEKCGRFITLGEVYCKICKEIQNLRIMNESLEEEIIILEDANKKLKLLSYGAFVTVIIIIIVTILGNIK